MPEQRLTGPDEDRTLARLRALRSDLIDPTIAVQSGRVVKRSGDGALVELRSVVDAVRCAVEQNGMVERNAGLQPDRRIGIHFGDMVEESDGDLLGDGGNIAARGDGVAQLRRIYLSEDANRQVRSSLDFTIRYLGEAKLETIAELMRIYTLQGRHNDAGSARAGHYARTTCRIGAADKPSIAVLPFANHERRRRTARVSCWVC
jgi:adenylate cyclase